jgi:hypothetical protein
VHGVVVTVGRGRVVARGVGVQLGGFEGVLLPAYGAGEVRRSEHPRPPHRRAAHSAPLFSVSLGVDAMANGSAPAQRGIFFNLLGLVQPCRPTCMFRTDSKKTRPFQPKSKSRPFHKKNPL